MANNHKGKRKKWYLVAIASVILVGGSLGIASALRPNNTIDSSKLSNVTRGDLARSVVATGKVEPLAKVEVKSKASGIVEKILADYGDHVKQGQVLVELDKEQLRSRVAEAAALWRQLAAVSAPFRWGVKKDFSVAPVERDDHGEWLYQETVAPLALKLDFAVTVFDDRPELANHQFFPPDVRLQVGGWHELLKVPLPPSPAFGLIVTRGHQHDALVLSEWIRLPFVFLGMIGSRRKARIMREQFLKQKIATAEQFDQIACPVGVDILAKSTQEIAVSILAQFIQKRAEKRDE